MDFDLISMKQRAKGIMSGTTPSPLLVGVILGVIAFAYVVVFYVIMAIPDDDSAMWLFYLTIAELVYLNFRTSMHWYCLKVTREETTQLSDAFLAFKRKPVQAFFGGLIKDICFIAGGCLFCVGWILPLYWFRFATYIIYDNDDVSVFGAFAKSMKLLKGHYMELVKLDISNLGWFALAFFTSGIACFYVKPYTTMVYAEFYDYLKGQAELFGA